MTRRACRQRGFTLAEVVITVAILSMIGTLVFGTFSRAMAARSQAEAVTQHYHQIRQAMLRMVRELQSAYVSRHRDCADERTDTVFKRENGGSGDRLDFVSFSHYKVRADANESDQQELSYFVDQHPNDPKRKALLRRQQSRIDEDPDEGGDVHVLADNVEELAFEFYDPKEDRWIDDWDSKSTDYKNRLPMFVRIELVAKGPSGQPEKFVTKTRIFLQDALFLTGVGFSGCID